MARHCHNEGLREQARMREHSVLGKYDVGFRDEAGQWNHVSRYSSKEEAEAAAERLSDPCEETRRLVGVPENPDIEIIER